MMTPWELKGREFAGCNCAYGCPCQFNALPTQGNCQAIIGMAIDDGHFGGTRLGGARIAAAFKWPGPIHEGQGEAFLILDENADAAQRESLLTILSGGETEPGATVFNVFAATLAKVHDPVFRPIELDIDIAARRGRLRVDGYFESAGEPIRNPVTGAEHRARIQLPQGFEYAVAEIASATGRSTGPVEIAFSRSHAHFCELHMTNAGVVRS
jgi:hypothetical protein